MSQKPKPDQQPPVWTDYAILLGFVGIWVVAGVVWWGWL